MDVDFEGVKSLIKIECIDCNLPLRRIRNTVCDVCNFTTKSKDRKSSKNYFTIGITPKQIFKKYGIKEPSELGKGRLFYFLYNPQLNFELPDIPPYDMFGNPTASTSQWVLHHMDKQNWNDHIWNILLCLRNEHSYFEVMENGFRNQINNIYKLFLK